VLAATEKATDEVWPGVPVVPIMVMGGTDGAFLRKEGIPTYGVMGLFMEQSDMRFHGRDERIPVASFYEAQTFLYKLVKELSQ
jgi:acetylornithine deacetylase/succinyl-diaminopimelate desuccinylase-like protein